MKLVAKANSEQLLLQLLGVRPWRGKVNSENNESYCVLLGKDEPEFIAVDGKDTQLYVRLPDTTKPSKETERLSRMLANAIGQGDIHL